MQTDNNTGIAYTYNEPFTFYEFMFETAQLAKENGLKNVVVSNGYINPDPLKKLLPFIDAFNIDLKAFSEEFYHKTNQGKTGTGSENPRNCSVRIVAPRNHKPCHSGFK